MTSAFTNSIERKITAYTESTKYEEVSVGWCKTHPLAAYRRYAINQSGKLAPGQAQCVKDKEVVVFKPCKRKSAAR